MRQFNIVSVESVFCSVDFAFDFVTLRTFRYQCYSSFQKIYRRLCGFYVGLIAEKSII